MASQKLTALTALTTPAPEDLTYIVDDVAGTPVERKITLADLARGFRTVVCSGQSLTGSQATSLVDLAATWNTSGTPTAILLNVTETGAGSGAASLLMDLRVGGADRFRVDKTGRTIFGSAGLSDNHEFRCAFGANRGVLMTSGNDRIAFSFFGINISSNTNTFGLGFSSQFGSVDVALARDAANTLALRNAANAQTFRVYNTFTDASNHERGFMRWSSNVFEIGTEAAGTGASRLLRFTSALSTGTSWEFRSSTLQSPTLTLAGTDRSVVLGAEVNALNTQGGGYRSSLDYSIGATTSHALRHNNTNATIIYFGIIGSASSVMQVNSGTGRGSGFGAAIECFEMTAPAAPPENGVRIYAEDNGSGKTRLMARFATGAAQQIAIEP